jgi:hypothetical protein
MTEVDQLTRQVWTIEAHAEMVRRKPAAGIAHDGRQYKALADPYPRRRAALGASRG